MKATIAKTFTFDAAHQLLALPDGHKCKRMHGHTYRVTFVLKGDVDPATGFVVDYAELAAAWAPIHEAVDHRYLNDVPGLEVPSTEILTAWIIRRFVETAGAVLAPLLVRVRVEESSTTWCELHVTEAIHGWREVRSA